MESITLTELLKKQDGSSIFEDCRHHIEECEKQIVQSGPLDKEWRRFCLSMIKTIHNLMEYIRSSTIEQFLANGQRDLLRERLSFLNGSDLFKRCIDNIKNCELALVEEYGDVELDNHNKNSRSFILKIMNEFRDTMNDMCNSSISKFEEVEQRLSLDSVFHV